MKKAVSIIILFVFSIIGSMVDNLTDSNLCIAGGLKPIVIVNPSQIKLDNKIEISIKGTDFKPSQKINILFETPDGVQSDIGYALKPEPNPDETGSWTSTWNASRYAKKKLIKHGTYKIIVTNSDYIPITHATVSFIKK